MVAVVLEEEINFSCLFVEVLLVERTIKIGGVSGNDSRVAGKH